MNDQFIIDDITWNDLNMEEIYDRINCASSSVGQEYLKKTLKTLEFDQKVLDKREAKAESLRHNAALAEDFRKIFRGLGKTKKVSFLDHIFKIREMEPQSNGKHYALILLLLISIALIFVTPAFGMIALVVMIALNIALYFRFKAGVEGYFNSMKYLVSMVAAAAKILKLHTTEAFAEEKKSLENSVLVFKPLKRGSWLITNSISGSLTDIIMDYIRMIFHVDLIKFNRMKKCAQEHETEIQQLYDALGEMETALCITQYRKKIGVYCRPEFSESGKGVDSFVFAAENMYHPLVKDPVKNSLHTKKSILLTGSNASGKSTFLKTLAINQIFAQTIHTCLADAFQTRYYKVLSSMALTDNLLGKESYFIVEIKSLKRIFDSLDPVIPVMAFVDEVLRGTNTAERIAASSRILEKLSGENALIFAATHDIELTRLLSGTMDNYHFSEHVKGNDVQFDYLLKEGPSTSRNAILLLKAFGFDPEITGAAEAMAKTLS